MSNNKEVISFIEDTKSNDEGFGFTVQDLVQQGDENITVITETTPIMFGIILNPPTLYLGFSSSVVFLLSILCIFNNISIDRGVSILSNM